jgi:type IV secretory pathway VirB10-like protein
MMRRVGRPGLVGTMARTAVVAGTATAVVGGMSRHQAGKQQQAADAAAYQQEQQQAQMQAMAQQAAAEQAAAQAAAAPPPPPAAAPANDLTSQLQQLATLKEQGILSDEEFAAAKAKLLSGG